ncbi:hypothetical protein L6452_18978 [Arctium lappa]|uniref:Uncharacterized protein n=1 Tax=Arctium lappa TaxID=4217 RepID=A0ACB9B8I9_ARCLA|nr:hypothetical protein L6452_18978 [Arctium lappa]
MFRPGPKLEIGDNDAEIDLGAAMVLIDWKADVRSNFRWLCSWVKAAAGGLRVLALVAARVGESECFVSFGVSVVLLFAEILTCVCCSQTWSVVLCPVWLGSGCYECPRFVCFEHCTTLR